MQMKNNDINAVIIFVRYPEKGKVKTRLAKEIGEESALSFYTTCAENTFDECKKIKSENILLYLFYSGVSDNSLITKWAGFDFVSYPQIGSDLGKRINNSFKEVFTNKIDKAVIIGTDIPDINAEIINQSFEILNSADIVIGPSADGGYYLLGMKKPYDFLFDNIQWSTGSVFRETMSSVLIHNLTFFVLPELIDIDTKDDFIKWSERNKQ